MCFHFVYFLFITTVNCFFVFCFFEGGMLTTLGTMPSFIWLRSYKGPLTGGPYVFVFFIRQRLLQVTPDLPEVQKLHRKNNYIYIVFKFQEYKS